MPTNKLWLEHTERAAWDSVEALREKLSKAESRLQALAGGTARLPELLDLLDTAKPQLAPDAETPYDVVARLLARIDELQSELEAAQQRSPVVMQFSEPAPRPRLDSEDYPERGAGDDDELELQAFTRALSHREQRSEAPRHHDLERLIEQAEAQVDELGEAEGAALRDAALELALCAARIYAASRRSG